MRRSCDSALDDLVLDRRLRTAPSGLPARGAKSCEAFDDLVVVETFVRQNASDDCAGSTDAAPAVDVHGASSEAVLDGLRDFVVPVIVDDAEVRYREPLVAYVEAPGCGNLCDERLVGVESIGGSGQVDEGAHARVDEQVDLWRARAGSE